MKIQIFIKTLLIAVLFSACAKVTDINSSPFEGFDKANFRYYDAESKVRYKVSNDDKYLYLTLNTVEQSSIIKILRTGLWIYFDTEGKKRRNTYLQYPLVAYEEGQEYSPKEASPMQPDPMRLKNELSRLNHEALFFTNGKEEFTSALLGETQIIISSPSNNELTYHVQIPLVKIFPEEAVDKNSIAIGVISGGLEAKGNQGGRNTNDTSMPGSQMPGSNMQGTNGGGTGGGQMSDVGRPDFSTLQVPIDFWFRLTLNPV